MPADVVLPHITYQDVDAALGWLTKAFGFTEHYHYGEPGESIQGAQMHLGDAWIMLNSARPGRVSPAQAGHRLKGSPYSSRISKAITGCFRVTLGT